MHLKKKGKVTITKPAIFARRTLKKKFGKEEEEIILKKPPPTFEERIKAMEIGPRMINLKILKYELRTAKEQKQIEDIVMTKMGKWKSPLISLPKNS